MSVLHDFETIRPSFEPLFERFLRNFTGEGIPKGERLEALNVEVTLSPEEAARGVAVPVGVPVFYTCSECGGSGRDWLFQYVNCNAQGIIEEEKTVKVYIPRMAPDRTVIEIPVQGLGIVSTYEFRAKPFQATPTKQKKTAALLRGSSNPDTLGNVSRLNLETKTSAHREARSDH